MEPKQFSDWRPSMRSNCLLIDAPIGHVTPSTYNLPPPSYRYGKVTKSNGSVAECFRWDDNVRAPPPQPATARYGARDSARDSVRNLNYDYGRDSSSTDSSRSTSTPQTARTQQRGISNTSQHRKPSTSSSSSSSATSSSSSSAAQSSRQYDSARYYGTARSSRRAKTDFIETNKQALECGCITARDFREFREENYIPVKQNQRVSKKKQIQHERKVKNMVHGVSTPYVEEMKDCLTYKTLNDALERAVRDKELNKEKARLRKQSKPTFKTASRATKASRGHTFKPAPPPTEADTFKMKRFKNIRGYAIDDKW